MGNPFNQLNPTMNMIRNAYQMLTQASNPMAVFQQLVQQNPSLQPAMDLLRNGLSPQQVFNTMCQQRNINPQDFLRQITGK